MCTEGFPFSCLSLQRVSRVLCTLKNSLPVGIDAGALLGTGSTLLSIKLLYDPYMYIEPDGRGLLMN